MTIQQIAKERADQLTKDIKWEKQFPAYTQSLRGQNQRLSYLTGERNAYLKISKIKQ